VRGHRTSLWSNNPLALCDGFRCLCIVMCCGFLASRHFIRKSRHDFGVRLVCVGLQPFQLRVAVDATLASKEINVERKGERVARTCERYVKQAFHFLPLDLFHFFFQICAIASVERDERWLAGNDKRITNVPAESRLTR